MRLINVLLVGLVLSGILTMVPIPEAFAHGGGSSGGDGKIGCDACGGGLRSGDQVGDAGEHDFAPDVGGRFAHKDQYRYRGPYWYGDPYRYEYPYYGYHGYGDGCHGVEPASPFEPAVAEENNI
jgi:hypothetical protein